MQPNTLLFFINIPRAMPLPLPILDFAARHGSDGSLNSPVQAPRLAVRSSGSNKKIVCRGRHFLRIVKSVFHIPLRTADYRGTSPLSYDPELRTASRGACTGLLREPSLP